MNETCQKQWENMVNNLIRLRKEKGLSRREMARLLGIGPLMQAKIEQGTLSRRLSAEIFLAIEEVFGLLPSQILSPWPKGRKPKDLAPRRFKILRFRLRLHLGRHQGEEQSSPFHLLPGDRFGRI